ncbi:NADPH:quinone reductase [Amycolatopsis rhabdoformis]|uniref:NADPH:quinone reductase n=1 Tax=Amycolatopsis rhabdoformis TaxID=1448059 RepID=A0ABZ1I5J4_9PSEU|nr:NADPH:quinone reductase [Amycolatopsis rhabdoformis]WSE29655.1 NADPH:quinone reductase [Amycolatopsis rhabdoformis]
MQAIVFTRRGGVTTVRRAERSVPVPGPGEVRVRLRVSGVNPLDAKWRGRADDLEYVPHHDGAGVVDAVGPGVDAARTGERVWVWGAGWQRSEGTAQEFVVLPAELAVPLPDNASFELGASLGIPALTAHRCLTLGEGGPQRLGPGALAGRTVLVAGGAGAVGNAAIQLARWAGAAVVTTVSSPEKAVLAKAAGADHVVDYRAEGAAEEIRRFAPAGVDLVAEVNVAQNSALDRAVLAPGGTVACYATVDGEKLVLDIREMMMSNFRWQGVFLYAISAPAAENGVAAVSAAVADGALRCGAEAGLPLHRYPLDEVVAAQDAALDPAVIGKPLITLP